MFQNNKLILLLFLFINQINAQKLEILADSVFVDSVYIKINELKISSNTKLPLSVYKIFQDYSRVFEKPFLGFPEKRLKAKIDTLNLYVREKVLAEKYSGFEEYQIYMVKNNIINFAIITYYYSSLKEDWDYFLIDLATGKRIESNLFINPKNVLKICKSKLKENGFNWHVSVKDLKNFQFIKNENNSVTGLDIIFFDDDYTKRKYEPSTWVHFSWKEIEKCISPLFTNRLK